MFFLFINYIAFQIYLFKLLIFSIIIEQCFKLYIRILHSPKIHYKVKNIIFIYFFFKLKIRIYYTF